VVEALKSLNAKFAAKEADVDTTNSGATGFVFVPFFFPPSLWIGS
jgi:hypothetical protein